MKGNHKLKFTEVLPSYGLMYYLKMNTSQQQVSYVARGLPFVDVKCIIQLK